MALLLVCATAVKAQSFVTVENGKLYRDGKPLYFHRNKLLVWRHTGFKRKGRKQKKD